MSKLVSGVGVNDADFNISINVNNRDKHLGYYATPMEAHYFYQKAKESLIRAAASIQQDRRIAGALIKRANKILVERWQYEEIIAI